MDTNQGTPSELTLAQLAGRVKEAARLVLTPSRDRREIQLIIKKTRELVNHEHHIDESMLKELATKTYYETQTRPDYITEGLEEHPEPQGYLNQPGYVKSNPLNNESYLLKAKQAYPEIAEQIQAIHDTIVAVAPEYNIAQIKLKFNELRFYANGYDPTPLSEEQLQNMRDTVKRLEAEANTILRDSNPS